MRWLPDRRRLKREREDQERGKEMLRAAHDRDPVVDSVAAELSDLHKRNHYAERLSIIMRGHA
jgi:hypothetical protein